MNGVAILEAPGTLPPVVNGDEPLYEVVYGQRVELPPMSIYAVRIASVLQTDMEIFARTNARGRTVAEGLFILDAASNLRRRPDVAFVSADRWPLDRPLPEEGDWEVVPDLAVEVVSPNDLFAAVLAKLREYFDVGVRQVWLVIPSERLVYVYSSPTQVRVLTAADELDGGDLLRGFRLPLAPLFQG